MTKYAFISIQGGQTVREKELAISQAKSHAARAAHRTKKLILLSAGKPEKTAQPEDNQVATQTPAADPSPWHWSKGARRDPFNCIPGSDSVTAGIAIDFMHNVVSPIHAAIAGTFGVSNLYGSWLLEQMASSRDVLDVVVASMLSLARPLMKLAPASRQIVTGVYLHKEGALAQLRNRIELSDAGVDDSPIMTVIFLAILEGSEHNRDAERAHRSKAAAMIQALASQFQIQDSLSADVEEFDFLGFDGPRPETFEMLTHEEALLSMPPGFVPLAERGLLGNETIAIINRLARRDYTINPWPVNEAVYAPLKDFCPAVYSKRLSVDKLVCLGLVRYGVLSIVGREFRACVFHSVTEALAIAVKSIDPPVEIEYRQCLIWIWLVAVHSWLIGGGELEVEGVVLLAQMRSHFPETNDWTTDDVEALGARFFWCTAFHEMVMINWT
ncbi:hypothetical protein B0A52_08279 [Exophiala mesophila]|uniref:Transcription factor domain-containing protein n=1 Tax=Exophiala mesophila TaxID=212818 RepID=A0A438MWK3_EXOME|nr:hypothetical protein B0A52_08279 [Exophiala mesophila]